MSKVRAWKRLTRERRIVAGRRGAVRIDEGETAIDGRFGAKCRPDLVRIGEREHCFPRWQAVLLATRDVFGKQHSTVDYEEAQVARRFRGVGRRWSGLFRDLPAKFTVWYVHDALGNDLSGAAGW